MDSPNDVKSLVEQGGPIGIIMNVEVWVFPFDEQGFTDADADAEF